MRLIDADVLLDSIFKSCNTTEATINNAPTIDAVPVVRCGECRFRNTSWYDKRDVLESFCRWDRDESPNDDDYCSYGEKKEDKS